MSLSLALQNKKTGSDHVDSGKASVQAKSSRSPYAATDAFDPTGHLQRSVGNQGTKGLIATSLGFDFAKISILQSRSMVSQSGDTCEQEADRVAEKVMRMSVPNAIGSTLNDENRNAQKCATCGMEKEKERIKISRKSSDVDNPGITDQVMNNVNNARSSGGSSLDTSTKEFMESRFGFDFSKIRIHTDERAARSAHTINALAYTLGNDVVFGSGQYSPDTLDGRRLLAHELTHVIQQRTEARHVEANMHSLTQAPVSIQRKLVLAGYPENVARAVRIINAGIGVLFKAQVNADGEIEIVSSGVAGPPSPQQEFFTNRLRSLVNETETTAIGVVSGGLPVVGSYSGQIDIQDIEALGIGLRGFDARAALLHEIVEQRERQLGTTAAQRERGTETTGAHGTGIAAELGMIGAIIESDTLLVIGTTNPDGTVNGTRTVIFRYPDQTRLRVELTMFHNNITRVVRTPLRRR